MKVHKNSIYLKRKSLAMLHVKTDQRQLHKDKIHERAAIAESLITDTRPKMWKMVSRL